MENDRNFKRKNISSFFDINSVVKENKEKES